MDKVFCVAITAAGCYGIYRYYHPYIDEELYAKLVMARRDLGSQKKGSFALITDTQIVDHDIPYMITVDSVKTNMMNTVWKFNRSYLTNRYFTAEVAFDVHDPQLVMCSEIEVITKVVITKI